MESAKNIGISFITDDETIMSRLTGMGLSKAVNRADVAMLIPNNFCIDSQLKHLVEDEKTTVLFAKNDKTTKMLGMTILTRMIDGGALNIQVICVPKSETQIGDRLMNSVQDLAASLKIPLYFMKQTPYLDLMHDHKSSVFNKFTKHSEEWYVFNNSQPPLPGGGKKARKARKSRKSRKPNKVRKSRNAKKSGRCTRARRHY